MTPALFFLGLVLGSFVNVLIHRIPREESIVHPRSRCPACRKPIRWYDNIPLASFAWLKGRCRSCRTRISWRYPVVEALVGMLAAGLGMRWGGDWAWLAVSLAALCVLVAIAFIDLDTMLIPDALSLGLLAGGLAVSLFNPLLDSPALPKLAESLIGAAVGFGLTWATAALGERLFKKEALGGGDIKLLAAVGAWSGWLGAFNCLFLGSLAGAVYGVYLIATGRIRRRDPMPFGPFLSLGAAFNFFYTAPFGFPFL